MACEKDYSKGLIYTIRTDDGLYVGSTINFKQRKNQHKCNVYNENDPAYNNKLYKNIRENDGEYLIELYKPFPCNSKQELEKEETKLMMVMNANLNTNKAYISEEERKEEAKKRAKEYYENNKDVINAKAKEYYDKKSDELKAYGKLYNVKNKDKIRARKGEIVICECGCQSTRGTITKHRKSKKHLILMKELDDLH